MEKSKISNNNFIKIKNIEYEINKEIVIDKFYPMFLFINEKGEKFAGKIFNKKALHKSFYLKLLEYNIEINKILKGRKEFVQLKVEEENKNEVYLLYEYIENGTLKDLIKKRKKLTEKEVQCYMIQLIFALNYLHSKNIIFKNLKPSKLFIGNNMELKVGGFSIDTIEEILKRKEKEKEMLKKEINKINSDIYMAAEIHKSNYSFALDIWSLGIIIYYLLTGENPSKKDLSEYKVRFPSNANLSAAAKDLLKQILVENPENRPTLNQIIYHDFFNRNDIPKYMPIETLEKPPSEFPEEILKNEVRFKDLKSIIKPIIPPITYESIQNLDEIKKNEAKDIDVYILNYLDYNSKCGVGYLLNNDYIGVYYRDKSLMTLNKNKNDEIKYKGKDEERLKTYKTNNISESLDNKYKILNHFIKYFDGLQKEERNKKEKNVIQKKDVNDKDDIIYVDKLIINENCIFFKLSNQTEQAFFRDKIQIIISTEYLTYIDENKNKYNLLLKDVANNPIHKLTNRFKYIKYIYVKSINETIKKNNEKIKQNKKQMTNDNENEKEIEAAIK